MRRLQRNETRWKNAGRMEALRRLVSTPALVATAAASFLALQAARAAGGWAASQQRPAWRAGRGGHAVRRVRQPLVPQRLLGGEAQGGIPLQTSLRAWGMPTQRNMW